MILTELRQRLNLANEWVKEETPADRNTYWTRPTRTAISIACRAAWGEGVSVYASDVGHRDMRQWHYDAQQRLPQNRFVRIPEGNPSRAAHYTGRELVCSLGQYDVACLRYEQSGPPTLLLASKLRWGNRDQVLADFDYLRRSSAVFRVMVYNLDTIPICDLAARIHHADTQPGGTYLFAAFQDGRLVYKELAQ